MDEGIYKFGPVYNSRVKISDWFEQFLQYPLDNPGIKGESHYKSFGPNDKVFIPKTTTQEMLEQYRLVNKKSTKGLKHTMINFTSYPIIESGELFNDPTILRMTNKKAIDISPETTTYKRSYGARWKIVVKKEPCENTALHPLLNRLPKNDFDMASKASPNMFMDDHFSNLSEQKKCNNFLRQIRKTSFVPWLGDYQKINKKCY